jgi:hypothetical protein
MKLQIPMPESLSEAASFMAEREQKMLWDAAVAMADARGGLVRLSAMFGRRVEAVRARVARWGERAMGEKWSGVTGKVQEGVEETLWNFYGAAAVGVPAVGVELEHRAMRGASVVSGVASGFVGLPGVLFDLPFTTMAILRSITAVARDFGEDLAGDDTKRACLEVLAFGGPSAADDATETGYWAARAGMNHAAINVLIRTAAGRFGVVLSEKFLAQAVPVAGAVAGGALNWAFTDYYQKMAKVHFALRAADRGTNQPARVRAVFREMVAAARDRRRIFRRRESKIVGYIEG